MQNFLTAAQRVARKLTASNHLVDRAALREKDAVLELMAEDCRIYAANTDAVTADDLELIGWTPAQIKAHGRDAARRALSRSARSLSARG